LTARPRIDTMTGTVRFETLLKPRYVAKLCDVSPRTVVRWINEGRIPAVKVGRVWRIRARDLDRFLNGR
jgi:excisionase family DNA binding protein